MLDNALSCMQELELNPGKSDMKNFFFDIHKIF